MESHTLLLVDDEPSVAKLTAEYVQKNTDNIETIIEQDSTKVTGYDLTSGEIDCIVCDFDMPSQTGLELLEDVREVNEELPFILYTGKGSEEIASKAISKGVTDYMQKSTGDDHYTILTNRIQNAINTYHSKLMEKNSIENQILSKVEQVIATPHQELEQKIQGILELGTSYVGVSSAFLSHIDENDLHIVSWYDIDDNPQPAESCPLEETYCQHTSDKKTPLVVEEATGTMYEEYETTQELDIESYIGIPVYVGETYYGTICFIGKKKKQFTESEKQFVSMIGNWVSYELTQHSVKQQLEENAQQSEQFSKMLSHDLRNIFNVTQGYAELLSESDSLSEQDQQYVSKITDSMERVIGVTENLQTLHESKGKPNEDSIESDTLREIIRGAWDGFCGSSCEGTLEIDSSVTNQTVTANLGLFKQALGNIFLNALEHNEPPTKVTVSATTNQYGDLKEIYIEDDGTGFDENPSKYLEPDITTKENGNGLGLYISNKVCEHHLWKLSAENGPSGGAKFTINLQPEKTRLNQSVLSSSIPTQD